MTAVQVVKRRKVMSEGVRWSVLVGSGCGKVKCGKWDGESVRLSLGSTVSDHLKREENVTMVTSCAHQPFLPILLSSFHVRSGARPAEADQRPDISNTFSLCSKSAILAPSILYDNKA